MENFDSTRLLKWVGGIVILGLVVWGVILLDKQSQEQEYSNIDTPKVDEVSENDWVYGNRDAKITLIEYGDFQCSACATYSPIIKRLAEDYKDDLRFVFRHFPLITIHKNARISSEVAESAGRQGKFWEMLDLLFTKQSDWDKLSNPIPTFTSYAQDLGLDVDKFLKDLESDEVRNLVESSRVSANEMDLGGTPTFILDGEKISVAPDYNKFSELIEQKINARSDTDSNTTPTTTAE